MFGGPKAWADRNVAPKPCRACDVAFQPKAGGSLYCDPCKPELKRRQHAESQRTWRQKNPERHAAYKANLDLKAYGMTLEGYRAMLSVQGGGCALCGTTDPRGRGKTRKFAVDHCHATGKVRALLCHRCNGALGMVGDDVEILQKMIAYVVEHSDA